MAASIRARSDGHDINNQQELRVKRKSFLKILSAIVFGTVMATGAHAQDVTRIVVPFPAGGGTDQYLRLLSAELTKKGMQVVVENKPGASGIIAADYVARSRADGKTILMTSLSVLVSNTVTYEKLPYDPQKDLASVTQIGYQPSILVARPDAPFKNIKEMVAYAKANPGKINRGSPGASIITNLAPIAFEQKAGISTTHIPFPGDAPGLQALLGGQIDIQGTSITGPLQHIRAGKMIVLGVMDSKRLPLVPEAMTFKEQGYDIEALSWYALSVPAGTPRPIINGLNKAIHQVLNDPEFVAKARAIGIEPKGGTPEELDRYIHAESDRWVPVLRSLNLPKQ
jgi:tripartite-type tricarboxylate transporter receptor subunit TctC